MFIIFSKLLKGGFSHLQADLSGKAQRRSGIWPHSRHQQHIRMAWRKCPSPALRPQPSLWINTVGWNAASNSMCMDWWPFGNPWQHFPVRDLGSGEAQLPAVSPWCDHESGNQAQENILLDWVDPCAEYWLSAEHFFPEIAGPLSPCWEQPLWPLSCQGLSYGTLEIPGRRISQ